MAAVDTIAFFFGILGNMASFLVYLAPLQVFYKIYKNKSTMHFSSVPYVVPLFSSMLWLYYAQVAENTFLLLTINSVGCAIEVMYIVMYIIYAPWSAKIRTLIMVAMSLICFAFIFLITHFAVHHLLRAKVIGWMCVSFSVAVFASPLSVVVNVIRTRSVEEYMSLPLSFLMTLSATMWLLYGIFVHDMTVILPNVLGIPLGVSQMLLYAKYKNNGKDTSRLETIEL